MPNPGFEWHDDGPVATSLDERSLANYWIQGLYAQPQEAWYLQQDILHDEITTVSCLDNDLSNGQHRSTGLQTWFVAAMPSTSYLQIGWVRSVRSSNNGLLGRLWAPLEQSYMVYGPAHTEWRPYAQFLQSPADVQTVSILAQNFNAPGAVCFDDMILIRWSDD